MVCLICPFDHCATQDTYSIVVPLTLNFVVLFPNQIKLLMEGFFAHFFSSHRPAYHTEDVEWFLKLANQQDDWCVPNIIEEVVGGTADQNLLDEFHRGSLERERARTITLSTEVCPFGVPPTTIIIYIHTVHFKKNLSLL